MAEFQEVMKQWRRFCKSHSNCGMCEFGGKGICRMAHLSDVPYSDMELCIMSWAAEHPEPVYPTWEGWLITQGVIKENPNGGVGWPMPKLFEHIPVDIAEKLGLEPKGEV